MSPNDVKADIGRSPEFLWKLSRYRSMLLKFIPATQWGEHEATSFFPCHRDNPFYVMWHLCIRRRDQNSWLEFGADAAGGDRPAVRALKRQQCHFGFWDLPAGFQAHARWRAGHLVVVTPEAIDDLIKQGKILAGSRVQIARSLMGVAVRAGARIRTSARRQR